MPQHLLPFIVSAYMYLSSTTNYNPFTTTTSTTLAPCLCYYYYGCLGLVPLVNTIEYCKVPSIQKNKFMALLVSPIN